MSGWLVKSPPSLDTKKPIFNPKWRRRWFVLREGGVPGQYILAYYTDPTTKKLKGSIDLDQCYQVDSGLTYNSGKSSLTNLFNISTQKRIYYLSADTVEEMNGWVQSLCQACGLRAYQTDDDKDVDTLTNHLYNEATLGRKQPSFSEEDGRGSSLASTPRGGPNHTVISGPYMHLADCFTGGGPPSALRSSHKTPFSSGISSADISLTCGEDSVFLPNSPSGNLPRNQSFEDSALQGVHPNPPSRPPKPAGLRTNSTGHQSKSVGENYENVQMAQSMQSNRTNQRNVQSPLSSSVSTPQIYDDTGPPPPTHPPPPAPDSLGGGGGAFPPPQIDRRLKPARDTSGGYPTNGHHGERKLSTDTLRSTSSTITNQFDTYRSAHTSANNNQFGTLDSVARQHGLTSSLESVDSRRNSAEETIYYYMPSLQPSGQGSGKWDPIMIPAQDMIGQSIEYLDLDLPSADSKSPEPNETKKEVESPNTVYKTVDFVKTEAFNKTKKNQDQKYNIHAN